VERRQVDEAALWGGYVEVLGVVVGWIEGHLIGELLARTRPGQSDVARQPARQRQGRVWVLECDGGPIRELDGAATGAGLEQGTGPLGGQNPIGPDVDHRPGAVAVDAGGCDRELTSGLSLHRFDRVVPALGHRAERVHWTTSTHAVTIMRTSLRPVGPRDRGGGNFEYVVTFGEVSGKVAVGAGCDRGGDEETTGGRLPLAP
jgi:hypothetical protein